MVEITIRLEEDELKEIIRDKFCGISIGDSMDYYDLYVKYIDKLIDSGSATFFYGPANLDEWIKDTISELKVITPSHSDYDRIYKCLKEDKCDIGDGYFIAADLNNNILLIRL